MNIYKTIFAASIAYVYVKFTLSLIDMFFNDNSKYAMKNVNNKRKIIYKYLTYFSSSFFILLITYFTKTKPPRLGAVFASIYLLYTMLMELWITANLIIKSLILGSITIFSIVMTILLDNRITANRILF
jgi:hypothetical protein